MDASLPDKKTLDRIRALQADRREFLRLPPEEALEKILQHPQSAALVHSFPEADLHMLIKDLGAEDAMPLLALASGRQWEYLLDIEGWQRDRIDMRSLVHWMSLLLEADPRRFVPWSLSEKIDLVEYCLFKNIEVRIREHDQDPSDFGEEYFTLDNTYFVRLQAPEENLPPEGIDADQRQRFLKQLLEEFARHDHATFQRLLLEATHLLPAETEEEAYRWRTVRLAEKGLVPLEEAIAIYRPLRAEQARRRSSAEPEAQGEEMVLASVPIYPFHQLKDGSLFAGALLAVEEGPWLQQLQFEFASLCNRMVVADQKSIRDRAALMGIVRKACGFISMGLEKMLPQTEDRKPGELAAWLQRHYLEDLFRVGFGCAVELKWQVEKWIADGWFTRCGLTLTFWGEQWLGVLGGLLIKRPLRYDNYRSGVLYREFESLHEVAEAEKVFKQASAVDDLFSLMAMNPERLTGFGFLTYKNLLLTCWTLRHSGASAKSLRRLSMTELRMFFSRLLPGEPDPASDAGRRVPEEMKTDFVEWLLEETGLRDFEITETLGPVFEELFLELESEYGRVAARNLDPRFVQLFLVESDPTVSRPAPAD
jgi:hypothetical protein